MSKLVACNLYGYLHNRACTAQIPKATMSDVTNNSWPAEAPSRSRFSPYQIRVLTVLTLINFVNWIDRQIIYPLFPLLKDEFHVSYTQLGWLVAAFSLVHAVGSFGLGYLADRTSRKRVISFGILFWSGATFASGLAGSFRSLLTARAMVGVGEAAYVPSANAIISASFARRIRARVQGIFDLGMFIGGALGLALGGILAQWVGWRPAFFIVGVPGLLLAMNVVRLPEPPSEARAPGSSTEPPVPVLDLLRVPAYIMVLVSGWFIAFAGYSYVIWGTDFVCRYKGFSLGEAGILLGSVSVLAGILGVMTGAVLADKLGAAFPWGRALAPALGFLVSAPFILGAVHAPSKLAVLGLLFAGTFFMTWYHGPVTAIIHDLTPPRAHATAMGLYYLFVNLFATTAASLLTGKIADRYGMFVGMHCAVAAQVLGAFGFFAVIYCVRRQGLRHPSLTSYFREETGESLAVPATAVVPVAR
ncbi:MAG TPA: MFS transporter [Terriglobia bacterium]|nr:MFS transporter [Terriglobia bacterium]